MKDFFKNHGKHLLMFPIVLLLMPVFVQNQWMDLHNVGMFFRLFLSLFGSTAVGFIIEWIQGKFYGANRYNPEENVWDQHWFRDMMVTGFAGLLGGIAAEIFLIQQTM